MKLFLWHAALRSNLHATYGIRRPGQSSFRQRNETPFAGRKAGGRLHYECKDLPGNQYCELCIEIDYNEPQIAAFESVDVSPEVLDKYLRVYSSPEVPVRFTITKEGSTLFVQPGAQSAAPLEATAQDKFELSVGIVFKFNAAKNQMIQKRGGRERVFTKEN